MATGAYRHGGYSHFVVRDPKRRDIYAAGARDRVVHQLVADYLETVFMPRFITQSFAAQTGKGVSAAREYAFEAIRRLARRGAVWIGKLDVQKYFSNINHEILLKLLSRRIVDSKILDLCQKIIASFGENGRGLPLGNLTSQWFANIYLHEADWHAKHTLKILHYLRYNDDMIIFGTEQQAVAGWMRRLTQFAKEQLGLIIPPAKTSLACLPQAVDILGLVTTGERAWLRSVTAKKARVALARKARQLESNLWESACSYYGFGVEANFEKIFLYAGI